VVFRGMVLIINLIRRLKAEGLKGVTVNNRVLARALSQTKKKKERVDSLDTSPLSNREKRA
jgi:hypothetical protein